MKHLNLTILALLLALASFGQAPISGPSMVCVGLPITLTDATTGGVWSSSDVSKLTITSTTGVATGISAGVVNVTYTAGGYVTYSVTVEPAPASIVGTPTVCVGDTVMLGDPTTGGTWSSSTLTIGTISPFGVFTGVSPGTDIITYTTMAGCTATKTITVNAAPAPISGTATVCAGSSTTLSDVGGGTWSSASPVIATVGSASGIVTGVMFGVANISYTLGTGCLATRSVTVVAAPAVYTVAGGGSYCAGGSGVAVTLSGSSSGVTYQLYNGGVAVGSPIIGTGSALSFGMFTAAGTYTVVANAGTSCATTMTSSAIITVNPLPNAYAVTGGGAYCSGGAGSDIGLAGSDIGVSYQLYLGGTAVGVSVPGTGSSIDFGLFAVAGSYTVVAINAVTGCTNSMSGSAVVSITSLVTPSVTTAVTPGLTVCAGTTVSFTATPTGGGTSPTYEWFKDGTSVATGSTYSYIPATGDVVYVVLTSSAPCASPATATSATSTMTVDVPTITATATPASCGGSVTLAATGAVSYSWSPTTGLSCPSCASNTFVPAATTTYSVTGTDGSGCTGTASVSVDGNSISGYISYTGTPSAGDFKIWLVQFNPLDSSILATDSTANCVTGGMPYYEFMDKPAGSYLVKAKLNSSIPGTSGYIPTYGLSSATWDVANTVTHTSSADTMHINMIYGTVPSGPGFIAGYVYAGAGKNTSGDAPAANLTIYLKNAAGNVVTYAVTGSDGGYTFSSIAEGTYYIYPESYKYYTTPSAVITLAPGSDTAKAVNFKQHTTLGTITPFDFTIVPQTLLTTGINVYPNPTSGNLNISWSNQVTGKTTVTVTDLTGREIYTSALTMNTPAGQANFDLSTLADGVYVLSIKSDNVFYTSKMVKSSN